MTVAVVLELAASDQSSPYGHALLEACNIGMNPGTCVFGQDRAPAREGPAIAVVTWEDPAHSAARIDVGFRVRGTPQWQVRVLPFSPADPEVERWRTAGFAIATLVGEAVARKAAAPSSPPARDATPGDRRDPTMAAVRASPTRYWIDAELASTAGAQLSSPAAGGEVRVSSMLGRSWFLFGALGCTVQTMSVDSLSIVRPSASAGMGLVVVRLRERAEIALRANARTELIEATGVDPGSNVTGSGGRWVVGVGEAIDLSWMASADIGLVAGVDVSEMAGCTDFTAHGHVVAHLPALDVGVLAGLRLVLP